MSKLSIEQQNLIRELKKAYPKELRGLSDEQILTVYNEQLSQMQLNEDQQVSVMGLDLQPESSLGLALQSTAQPQIKQMTDEEKEQLKQTLLQRITVTEDNVNAAKKKNGFFQKTWSGIKNVFNIGDSSEDVVKAKQEELKILSEKSLEEAFKEITDQDATEENLTKFLNGEIKTKSEQALDGYVEGQEMVHDTLADMGSGILSFVAYTAAVAAAPATGGLSIALGVGLATGVGAGSKLWIKSSQAQKRGEEYTGKDFKFDLITGAVSGILAPFTGGAGSAVGKTVAVKCFGMQVFKQAGKELVEEGVTTGFKQGFKNAMLNAAGYEYKGKLLGRVVAYGSEMATDGALSGMVENGFRTAYEGGDAKEVFGASISGLGTGLIMSPVIGGGMRGAGKATRWLFGKSPEIDASTKTEVKAKQTLPPNVKSSLATDDDLVAIHKIDKENFEGSYAIDEDFSAYKADLEERGVLTYSLKSDDGKVLGYYQLEPIENGELYIYSIGVPPELQKTKSSYAVLKKIQEEITKTANEKGVKKVVLDVDADNKALVKLYEKFGFKITGEDKGFEAGSAYHDYRMEIDVNEYYAKQAQKVKSEPEIKANTDAEAKVKPKSQVKATLSKEEFIDEYIELAKAVSLDISEKDIQDFKNGKDAKKLWENYQKCPEIFMKFFEKDSNGKFKIKENDIASILMDNYLLEVEKISVDEYPNLIRAFNKTIDLYNRFSSTIPSRALDFITKDNVDFAEKLFSDSAFPKKYMHTFLSIIREDNVDFAEKIRLLNQREPIDYSNAVAILAKVKASNISLAEKLYLDPNFPKTKICAILESVTEDNLPLAERLCYAENMDLDKISYILKNITKDNISLAEKICFDKYFPKDCIRDILENTRKENLSLAERICNDPRFRDDIIANLNMSSILKETNEKTLALAEKLLSEEDFPVGVIPSALKLLSKTDNLQFVERLCFDDNIPRGIISDIETEIVPQYLPFVEKLCFELDYPKKYIGLLLHNLTDENIDFAEKLCRQKDFPKDFPKYLISDIVGSVKTQHLDFAERLCSDKDFPENLIAPILRSLHSENLSFAEKLCFDPNFPKDQLLMILAYVANENISLAEKLYSTKGFPTDKIGPVLCFTSSKNIDLAEKLCFNSDFPLDRIASVLKYVNNENISLAEKLCFDPNFSNENIPNMIMRTNAGNLPLAEKMYLEDRLLFNVLSVTNAENLVLAEKLVFQSKMDINDIIIFLENTTKENFVLAKRVYYSKEITSHPNFIIFARALGAVKNDAQMKLYSLVCGNKILRENSGIVTYLKSMLHGYNDDTINNEYKLLETFLNSEKLQKNELLAKHLGLLICNSNSATTMKNITDYIQILQEAFARKDLLKSATEDISDEIITSKFGHKALDIFSALDILGTSTFIASFPSKISGVLDLSSKMLDLRDRLESRGLYDDLLKKINPENTERYKLLEKTIAELKKSFPEVKASGDAVKLKELQNEIATYTKEMQAIRKAKLDLSPQKIIEKVRVLYAIAGHNGDDIEKFLRLIQNGTKENEAIWRDEVNKYIFNVLGMPFDKEISDRLNLTGSKYLAEILSGNYEFRNNFKEIIELIKNNPTKSMQEIFDELPQNIKTKEMLESFGINYDKWCQVDKNSYVEVKVELKLEESRQAAIESLEKEFNNVAFTSLPKAETDKIFEALKEIGVELKTVTEPVYDANGFISRQQEVVRLYKEGEPIKFKDLSKIMKTIKQTINDNPFWNVTYADDSQINSYRETMLTHFTKDRDIQCKTARDLKEDKVVSLEVRKTDMNDISHSLFLGNHGSCCTAVGSGSNQFSAPTYIKNKMVSAIEVVDGDNFVGNTMCYIAQVDGKLSLILDNIELKADYHNNDAIRDAIIEYAKKLCAEIGQPDMPIYAGPYRHKLRMEVFEFKKHQMQIVGNTGDDDIYLDFITRGREVTGNEVDEVKLYKIR